ncbi:MAG: hypothetical protein AB7N76_17670 [Planctomycetota bacterium]
MTPTTLSPTTLGLAALALALAPTAARAEDDLTALREQARVERCVLAALDAVDSAQVRFRGSDSDHDGVEDYAADLAELARAKLLPPDLADGERAGYAIAVRGRKDRWLAVAAPRTERRGARCFARSDDGVHHALEPFALREDCRVPEGAVALGNPLPGYDPDRALLPHERALLAAAQARVVEDLVLRTPDGAAFLGLKAKGSPWGWLTEVRQVAARERQERTQKAGFDRQGTLEELLLGAGRVGEIARDWQEHGGVGPDGQSLVLLTTPERKEHRGAYPDATLPRVLALVVLPRLALAGKLELAARFPLLEDAFAADQPAFRLEALATAPPREGARPGERAFSLGDGRRTAVVWLDRQGVVALRDLDGQLYLSSTPEVFEREVAPRPRETPAERRRANESAAIGALRTLSSAQVLFREGDKDGNGAHDYAATLAALGAAQLIDPVLAKGEKQGYRFALARWREAPGLAWRATASPLDPSQGRRHFAIDQRGVIHESERPFALEAGKELQGGRPLRGR